MIHNKFCRWLVVIGNCVIAVVAVPISILISMIRITYLNIRYKLEIGTREAFGWYMEGLTIAYEANRKLIKTGRLTGF